MVGQNYLRLLENHPWFEVMDLAASERSAGKMYADAVDSRWLMPSTIPVNNSNYMHQNDIQVNSIKILIASGTIIYENFS